MAGQYGCCGTGSAMAFGRFAQTEGEIADTTAATAAVAAGQIDLAKLFGVSVAAGVTVFLITKLLSGRK